MNMLKLLQDHVSTDETRYHLCGAFFKNGFALATDGHRLVKIDLQHPGSITSGLTNIAKDRDGKIYSFKEHTNIDGTYPNCEQLIPAANKDRIGLDLEIPRYFAKIKGNQRAIFLRAEGLQLFKPDAETKWVALNPSYLASFADTPIHVSFLDAFSPVLITGDGFTSIIMPVRA